MAIKLNTIQALYDDMVQRNQSFIHGHFEYDDNTKKLILEANIIYRKVEISKGELHFHASKFGGSDLWIVGNIISAERVDRPDNVLCEYKLFIEGRGEPFVLVGCKKRILVGEAS